MYELYFDGCSKGNPGPAGAGAVLYNDGIEIPTVTDPDAWNILSTGAKCSFNNL
jgi:ribonuclease HI